MTEPHNHVSAESADLIQFAAHMARLLYNDATLDDCTEEQKRAWLSAAKALMTIYEIRTRNAAQAVGMREALEAVQSEIVLTGHLAEIVDAALAALAAQPPAAPVETGSMSAQWTYDLKARAYYFAPKQASHPPYNTREVKAIIDIANDGTLAGVELIEMDGSILPPPPIGKIEWKSLERSSAGSDYVTVPAAPTEAMWGGLARDIIMWTRFDRPSERSLLKHLTSVGTQIPDWLAAECRDIDHVPPKGSVAVWVYRAMLDARPVNVPQEAWQPMDTAPKDKCILVATAHKLRPHRIAWWSERQLAHHGNGWAFDGNGFITPLAWQPLPDTSPVTRPNCGSGK